MNPLIAMPAPWLPEAAAGPAGSHAGLPELAALTRLLRRGRRLPDAADWRAGVLTALNATAAAIAPGSVAARAVPQLASGTPVCFAAPLHVVVGISRVHLPPGGRLLLDAAEERAWCVAFNQEFGPGDARLHVAAAGGGWLLAAPAASAARDAAPEVLLGEPLHRQPAADAQERALRRLGSEVELWLAAHALNREREARREPPLNAIWFWGGACASALPPLHRPRCIAGHVAQDAWLAGLARHGATPLVQVQDWSAAMSVAAAPVPGASAESGAATALFVPLPGAQGISGEYWQMLEDSWFAPAARALQAGEIAGLRLQIGGGAWYLPRGARLRWLRWRRSWWQMSGQLRP